MQVRETHCLRIAVGLLLLDPSGYPTLLLSSLMMGT